MDRPKILSGQAIVAKGVTKIDATLPEVGLKDVTPNGSWLEQKQIQAALEARKHLVEVERIDKLGTLSHATWCEHLRLAEVTQKTGGYWQYLGHNAGKKLYLEPEEALYLMEVNCLLLKHGGVTVSLQKAYSLLLNEPTSFIQYRVYASLSRIGYKVFRHKIPKLTTDKTIPCHKTDSNKKSNDVGECLIIDTNVGENVTDQPLTDSSVEILESKIGENSNTNNINQPLSTTEHIHSTDASNVCKVEINGDKSSIEKSDESNTEDCNIKLENDAPIVMEVDLNINNAPIHNTENDSSETNANHVNDEENVRHVVTVDNKTQSVEIQEIKTQCVASKDSATQNIETKHDDTQQLKSSDNLTHNVETANTETENVTNSSKSEHLMDVEETAEIKTKEAQKVTTIEPNIPIDTTQNEVIESVTTTEMSTSTASNSNVESNEVTNVNKHNKDESDDMEISTDCHEVPDSTVQFVRRDDESRNVMSAIAIEVDSADSDVVLDLDTPKSLDFTNDKTKSEINCSTKTDCTLSEALISKRNQIFHDYVTKLKKLTSRRFKPSNFKTLDKSFENIPDLFKREVITINVPEQQYIPKNVFVNNSSYVLNMKQIKRKSMRSVSMESATYNSSDEVNGSHVRRIRSNSNTEYSQNLQFVNRFPSRQSLIFRPFNFWRPQNNYVQFNMFFQRPCFPNMFYHSRFQYQRQNPLLRAFSYSNNMNFNPNNPNMNNGSRKRMRSAKTTYLQSIKNLAVRLKQLIMTGNNHIQNIESLHRLLYAYNTRYKARLRLTKNFEIVNDENIVETIDLEEDEESSRKRRRLSKDSDMFDDNLNALKRLATKLKDLEDNGKSSPKHRRAMSKAIKTFNKSYDADIYLNSSFDVINRRFISIESDSESDCVVNEPKKVHKKKKLRNPFNILKRLSEKQAEGNPGTSKYTESKETVTNNVEFDDETKYSEHLSKTFDKNWLPSEDDFGRAEVVNKNVMNTRFTDAMKEEYLNNYIKNHFEEFNNWLEAKIAFLQHMEETDIAFQNEHEQLMLARQSVSHTGLKPLIDTDDCSDMPSVLEKLRIIKHNKEISAGSALRIHFDVYNRDVQNFRKKNPAKPHFRIICMEESSSFPTAAEVMALHSQYEDSVKMVFAIVGISSVSYLQINPIDMPVYVASNDFD